MLNDDPTAQKKSSSTGWLQNIAVAQFGIAYPFG
jgi:hypothetical protein